MNETIFKCITKEIQARELSQSIISLIQIENLVMLSLLDANIWSSHTLIKIIPRAVKKAIKDEGPLTQLNLNLRLIQVREFKHYFLVSLLSVLNHGLIQP